MVSSSNGKWFPSLLQKQKSSFNNKDDSKRNIIQFQKQKHCIASHCEYRKL